MDVIEHLVELAQLHSTPGDEFDVARCLTAHWEARGLKVRRHGAYAISASLQPLRPEHPVILICGHMDSPGFIVETIREDMISLVSLGGVRFPGSATKGRLRGKGALELEVMIEKIEREGQRPTYVTRCSDPRIQCGDRVCYAAEPELRDDDTICSPFLDNRVACAILTALADRREDFLGLPANVVIAATACEEMGGYGAPVLAASVKPDLVICLDCTYEAPDQDVFRGKGPVLTISDASVLIGRELRDAIVAILKSRSLPMQTEVYNYSGTDSKAFPHQGLPCPVLPLLVPTIGNHSPREEACCQDVRDTLEAVVALIHEAPGSFLLPTVGGLE